MLKSIKWKLINFFRVLNFIGLNQAKFDAIDEVEVEITNLNDAVGEICDGEDIQGKSTKGITEDVKKAKKNLADTMVIYAKKGLPLARQAKKEEFVKILKRGVSYIFRASKPDALSRARTIKDTLVENDDIFTNIKPADIADMTAVIKAYDDVKIETVDAIADKKADGTKAIKNGYLKGNAALQNIYDSFYGYYQKTEPELVEKLADCMAIDKEGVRHTGVTALIIDNKPPQDAPTNLLDGVLMRIVELNKSVLSDINGIATLIKLKPGTYHIEFIKEGFMTVKMIVVIKRGEIVALSVQMMKA